MTWVKLDDLFPDHPKVATLSDGAFRLHVSGLCYCSRYLTNGDLKATFVRRKRHAQELVAAGLWEDLPAGGWYIHDFLTYNPSREQVLREREKARERRANVGGTSPPVRKKRARRSSAPTRPDPIPTENETLALDEPALVEPPALTNGQAKRQARTELKEALLRLSGWDRDLMTPSTWGVIDKAAKEAADGGFDADDLAYACELYVREHPRSEVTPMAIIRAIPSVPKWQQGRH